MINYYHDMWCHRSKTLAPLAVLISKNAKWRWDDVHQKAFDDMKNIISKEVQLMYPDFSLPFDIHTNASHTQLGAVILQKGLPLAFYSRKLTNAQMHYTTEHELLSIIETLKEFRNILLGHKINVYTDHKNLTYVNLNTKRVMHWHLLIEEYSPKLHYIKDMHNVATNALS